MKKHPDYNDIPSKALVTVHHTDGTVGNHGIIKGADLHYMLRGYRLDRELGLWFNPNHKDWAYDVKPQ